MFRLWIALLVLTAFAMMTPSAKAQSGGGGPPFIPNTSAGTPNALPIPCVPSSPSNTAKVLDWDYIDFVWWYCSALNTWTQFGSGGGGSGTVQAGLFHTPLEYTLSGTTTTAGPTPDCTPPSANGMYELGYDVTASASVDINCNQVGLASTAGLTGATATYTFAYSDNNTTVPHDKAGTSAIAATLPTPTTLGNPNYYTVYCNYSAFYDTITPTTWTINGNASVTVPPKTCHRISVDPNNASLSTTNWLSICQGSGCSPLTPAIVNGVSHSERYTGSTLDVRVNACETDASTFANGNTSGICDSSGESLTQTIAAGITILPFTTWVLPPQCAWTETITTNTVDVIFQDGYSTIMGSEAPSRCQIIAGASGARSMYNNGTAAGYYRASDFFLYNSGGATMVSGADMLIQQSSDGSVYQDIQVGDYGTTNTEQVWLGGSSTNTFPCCHTVLRDFTVYGNNSGPTDLLCQAGTGGNAGSSIEVSGSFGHSANTLPEIKIAGCRLTFVGDNYVETNPNSSVSPVQISADTSSGGGYTQVDFAGTLHINIEGTASTIIPVLISGTGTPLVTADTVTTGGSGAYSSYPITIIRDTSASCPSSPCNTLSNAKGSTGSFNNQTSTATNFYAYNSITLNGAAASSSVCTNGSKVLVTSGCPLAGTFYQTVQQAGSALPQEPVLNFAADMACSDNPGVATNCTPSSTGGTAFSALTSSINTGSGTFGWSTAGVASTPTFELTGLPFAGTASTSLPLMLFGNGAAVTTWPTAGTYLAWNCNSGFTGNAWATYVNGGANNAALTCAGVLTASGVTSSANVTAGASSSFAFNGSTRISNVSNGVMEFVNTAGTSLTRLDFGGTTSSFAGLCFSATTITVCDASGGTAGTFNSPSIGAATPGTGAFTTLTGATLNTTTNCASAASPAVCGSAASGSVQIPTGTTSETLQVNTSAVTANSVIMFYPDDSLGTKLGVTCNSTLATLVGGSFISARAAGASFTITFNGTILTNGVCGNYTVVN